MKHIGLFLILLLFVGCFVGSAFADSWWNDDYQLRRQITITNNSSHQLQDTNNAITINISNQLGTNALANCNDVRIVKGNQTELDRNAVGNCQSDANIWFTLPVSISPNGSDNNYWIYYKNSSASAPTTTATFPNPARDMNCIGLYRFDGNYLKNECGVEATLTGTAGSFATQVRRDGYTFGNTSILNFGGPISKGAKTIEAWFNCGASCSTADNFISGGNVGADKFTQAYVNGGIQWQLNTDGGANEFVILGGTVLQANRWYYIALTCGPQGAKIFVDGNLDGSNASTLCFSDIDDALTNFGFGFATTSGNYIFDEGRVLNYQRTSGFWQSDINANAVQPTTLLGNEESIVSWWDTNWQYRQKLTLQTSKIGMSGNVTNDHVVLIDINSSNTNFWNNVNTNPINYTKIDTFETGTSTVPPWIVSGMVVNATYAKNGSYGIGGTTGQYAYHVIPYLEPKGEYDFNAWIKATAGGNTSYYVITQETPSGTFGTKNELEIYYQRSGNNIGYFLLNDGVNSGNIVITSGTTDGNWYKLNAHFNYHTGKVLITVYNYNDVNLGSSLATFNNRLSIKGVSLLANDNTAGFDDVVYTQNILGDVRFVNISNTATYNWHAEDINLDTNRLIAWVGITDTFPSGTDLNLYVYYGNNSAISDQNSIATYPSTYVGVWHEGETAGTISNDAIARDNGTITNALINQPNKIDGGYFLDGDGDYVTYANESNFDFLTNASPTFSLIQWIKTSAGGTTADQMFSKYQFNGGTHLGLQTLLDTGKGQIKFWTDPSNYVNGSSSQLYNDNLWHHIVFTADGNILNTTNIKFYGDSNLDTLTFTSAGTYTGSANAYPLIWGKQGDYANYFKGYNDELKILNYAVSANEVKLLYNSENDLNFILFGPQDTNQSPPVAISYKIDFNVYSAGTTTHLTNITADWNVNAYDVSGQNSPFSEDVNTGTYLVTFTKSGYDNNTNFLVVADSNKTYVIYLTLSIPPAYGAIDNNNVWKNFDFNIIVNDVNYLPSGKLFAKYSVDGGAFSDTVTAGTTENTLLTTDGNHLVVIWLRNNAGNDTNINVYGLLDKTAPTVTISGNTFATWTNTDQTITLTPTDGTSGIVLTQYSLDGGAWTNYIVPFLISTDLNHTIDFNTRDNAGNTSGIQTSWAAIDKTAPTIGPTFNALEWFAAPFYVIFSAINTGISGLFHIWVSIDNGTYIDANMNGTDSNQWDINVYVPINTDGNHDINIWIRDNAGNDTNLHTYGALDQTGPIYSYVDGNGVVKITDFNVTVHDVNYLPAGKMFAKYSINSGAFTDTVTADANEYALVTLDGNNSVRFWLRDNAGNDTNIRVYALLDVNAPTYSYVDGNGLPWKNYDFNVTVVDVNFGVSGFKLAKYQIDSNTGAWTNMGIKDNNYFVTITQDANHAVYIWLQDGNNHDTNLLVYALSDKNGPVILYDNNFGLPWRTADFNVGIDVNFATSGNSITKYSIDGSSYYDINFVNTLDFGKINQQQTITDGYTLIGNKVGIQYQRAQSFIPDKNNLMGITILKGANTGAPVGNIIISIRSDNSNAPSSTILTSKGYTSAQWNAFANTDQNIALQLLVTSGVKYWIVLVDTSTEALNASYSFGTNSAGGYPYGTQAYSNDGGTTWNLQANDMYFKTFYSDDLNFRIPIMTDGNHTIRGWFKDNAGNDTNTIGQAYLDKTGPSVGATILGAGFNVVGTQIWAVLGNGTIIGGTVSDPYSDVNTSSCEYTINNGATWLPATWNTDHCEKTGVATTPGTTPQYNTRVKDNVGNQGTGTATVVYTVDNVKPVTTDNTDTSWHGSSVTVTLSPTDQVSGVASTTYCVDDSNACVPGTAYTIPVVVTCPTNGICNRYIRYYSTDIAGNVENTKGSNAIKIDQNRPGVALTTLTGYNVYTTFINNNGTVVGGVATDYNGSGLNTATCEYTVNNGGAWAAATWNATHCEKTTAVAIVDGTTYQFNTRITDNVGNVGTGSATIAYTGDTVAPTTTPSGNIFATWTTVPQTITLTCVDARSGCNSIQYMVDSNGTWFTLNSAGPFTFILGTDGNHTIDFNSRDNVTNVETTKRTWAAIDVSAPTVGQTYIETTKISGVQIWGPVHIDATVSDVNGVISFCQYTINNGASWLAADLNATHCYKDGITVTAGTFPQYNLRATNLAGLTGTGTATIVYTADNVVPTVGLTTATFTSTYGTGPYYIKGTGTIVGGTATDAVSGIDNTTCEYRDTNTGTWAAGTWNVNHCEKIGWAAGVNGLSYYFNTRVSDLAGNIGAGAPSIRYTFDTNGPQVTYTYAQLVPGNPDVNVRLYCLDANSGCKYIWYNVDNTGWNRANTPSVDFNWFIVSGAGGHRIQYLGTDNLDNNSADLNLDLNVAGRLRIRIADENTGLWLNNTMINFNSLDYNDTNGQGYDINLLGMTSGLKVITFTKTGYGTRYYDLDMNAAGNYDVNMLMLASTKGAIVTFTFYMNDGTTLASNGFGDINRPDRNGFSIGRESLNVNGSAAFFINNTDQNYVQKITTSSGDVNYAFPVYLTILFPKDELTLLPIDNNWGFISLTNTVYSRTDINSFGGDYPALPGDANVWLMPNTGVPTTIRISDANGIYFPRDYSLIYLGNPLRDTLQPYLIQYLQGNNTTFITTNQLGFAIPGITIEVYKMINNVLTLVSSGVTDNSGAYTTSLAVSDTYTFKLYSNGVLVSPNPFVIQIVENKYYFTINTFGYPVDTNTLNPIQIQWYPAQEYLYNTTVLTQNISGATVNFLSVQAYQYTDANNTGRVNKFAQYYICTQSCSINEALANMTLNGGLDSNLELYIDVNVYYDGNLYHQKFTKNYRLNNNPAVNLMQLFVNAKRSFGCQPTVESICPWTTILALVLSIIAMGAVMYSLKIFNPFAMGIIGGICLVFFTIIGWFYWLLMVPVALVLIFGLFGRRGSE